MSVLITALSGLVLLLVVLLVIQFQNIKLMRKHNEDSNQDTTATYNESYFRPTPKKKD